MRVAVIGASAAGLAVAKLLKDRGLAPDIFEASDAIGARWQGHYDRLHLHTPASGSSLPGLAFPRGTPRYPSRDQVVAYLRLYAETFGLRPAFGRLVDRLRPEMGAWTISGPWGEARADLVVMATGLNAIPRRIEKPGLDSFPGPVLHSSGFRTGRDFAGQRVLVIGFGNSACEIALDLAEQGGRPAQSVRGPVNALPRDILGIPILTIGRHARLLPPPLADRLTAPLFRLMLGDLRRLGLRRPDYGPITQVRQHGRIPLLDLGTLAMMRRGRIGVYPDILRIEGETVHFADGRGAGFDAIVMATGYAPGWGRIAPLSPERLADLARPVGQRRLLGEGGIYVCGSHVSSRGMLFEIGQEARAIADHIAARVMIPVR
ncbi:flavin-containing monooxygenase [Paracoccus marinaquae]|uniref:NAD(P)/FAD-dependent oxidoreductase n=1 Tax=Paracoccus marinaquae TaxID=2841926 RepID=A0ABS6AMK4_9RHOB|nr:NAD(P)/FAD-dependent oxidoreductase [Paracoccus marinaquae]MBU3031831.1 NAD(P)/FAD-dependent oxidoreductase [Paracoccus marinaquae]